MARDVGISQPTAERWLSILVASNIVYLPKPYSNNITKRVVKTPKLYFLYTGFDAYLTKWNNVDVLKSGAMAGTFFESFVVLEIIKSYCNLYPLEMKKHADPKKKDIAAFACLDKIPNVKRGFGGVICLYENLISLTDTDRVIPIGFL